MPRIPALLLIAYCPVRHIGDAEYSSLIVAVHVEDARTQRLSLRGLGSGEPIHDWNCLLGRFGLLDADQTIAGALRIFGGLGFAIALVFGGWLLIRMATSRARIIRPGT